jgi:uncharacterized protein
MLIDRPGRWLEGEEGRLRSFGWGQGVAYFAIGVYAGLVVLGSGFFLLAALVLLTGCDLRQGNDMKAFILLNVGLQSLLIFSEARDVDWTAGVPLTLGSAVGAYVAARLATKDWARVWVYRFLVLSVVLAILHLLVVDSGRYLQHT